MKLKSILKKIFKHKILIIRIIITLIAGFYILNVKTSLENKIKHKDSVIAKHKRLLEEKTGRIEWCDRGVYNGNNYVGEALEAFEESNLYGRFDEVIEVVKNIRDSYNNIS